MLCVGLMLMHLKDAKFQSINYMYLTIWHQRQRGTLPFSKIGEVVDKTCVCAYGGDSKARAMDHAYQPHDYQICVLKRTKSRGVWVGRGQLEITVVFSKLDQLRTCYIGISNNIFRMLMKQCSYHREDKIKISVSIKLNIQFLFLVL